jgi:serine/threonine-protein kinase
LSHRQKPLNDERSLRFQIEPPGGGEFILGANTGGIALSPDGKTAVYFVSAHKGLWVRLLDGTTARLIPGTEEAAHPFWSPDNKSIAFFTATQLKRVDLVGGTPLTICDVVRGRGGAWSSDGQILFGTLVGGLFKVPASGGTPSALTTLDAARGEISHRWPQVLPGGGFLYWAQSAKSENSGIYAASLTKPTERVRLLVTDDNALYAAGRDAAGYLLWLGGRDVGGPGV